MTTPPTLQTNASQGRPVSTRNRPRYRSDSTQSAPRPLVISRAAGKPPLILDFSPEKENGAIARGAVAIIVAISALSALALVLHARLS